MVGHKRLLPCPFCGGEAGFESIERGTTSAWSIGCHARDNDCIAFQMLASFSKKSDAVEAWNKRAGIKQVGYHYEYKTETTFPNHWKPSLSLKLPRLAIRGAIARYITPAFIITPPTTKETSDHD